MLLRLLVQCRLAWNLPGNAPDRDICSDMAMIAKDINSYHALMGGGVALNYLLLYDVYLAFLYT